MKQLTLSGKNGLGKSALVDDEDYEALSQYSWYVAANGYIYRTVNLGRKEGKKLTKGMLIHRFITGAETEHVHHKNHNKLDNQRSNLQLVTQQQNNLSMGLQKRNRVGYKGVFHRLDRKKRPYQAAISAHGKRYILGQFPTALEAAQAYNAKAKKLHGEFALLNDLRPTTNTLRSLAT